MGRCQPGQREGPMVVNPALALATVPSALAKASLSPRVATPATFLGNARYGAPSWPTITIVVNAAIFFWTWMLVMLEGRAVLLGGRRCFFSVGLLFTDFVEMVDVMVMVLLLSRFPSASHHRGRGRPLGVASLRTRTVTRLVGRTPMGGGRWTGAPRTCATATSSTAAWTTLTKSLCYALMAMWSP